MRSRTVLRPAILRCFGSIWLFCQSQAALFFSLSFPFYSLTKVQRLLRRYFYSGFILQLYFYPSVDIMTTSLSLTTSLPQQLGHFLSPFYLSFFQSRLPSLSFLLSEYRLNLSHYFLLPISASGILLYRPSPNNLAIVFLLPILESALPFLIELSEGEHEDEQDY